MKRAIRCAAARLVPGCGILLLLLLAGCDTLEPGAETIVLPTRQAEFRFEFNVASAGAQAVSSLNQIDLTGQLQGFTKGDIVTASVSSARLERVQPVGQPLSAILSGAELQLTSGGLSPLTVATLTSVPGANQAPMALGSTNVTAFVQRPSFGARLALEGLRPGTYVLEVSVDLRIEVTGV